MSKSVFDYEKMIEFELKGVIARKCPKADSDHVFLRGVEENIALWSYKLFSFGNEREYRYCYTNLSGDLLLGNQEFSYAMPFSNGCALVQTSYPIQKQTTFIIDTKRHQILSVPPDFKNVNNIMYNRLPILDYESNKWGTYMINPETGEWSYDIPFIWDCLALSRNEGSVYVGRRENFCYHPNDDNTPYSHMVPGHDDFEVANIYRTTGISLSIEEACDFAYFEEIQNDGCHLVLDPRSYWDDYALYREKNNFVSTNDGSIVDLGNLKEYTLKKSYLKRN